MLSLHTQGAGDHAHPLLTSMMVPEGRVVLQQFVGCRLLLRCEDRIQVITRLEYGFHSLEPLFHEGDMFSHILRHVRMLPVPLGHALHLIGNRSFECLPGASLVLGQLELLLDCVQVFGRICARGALRAELSAAEAKSAKKWEELKLQKSEVRLSDCLN